MQDASVRSSDDDFSLFKRHMEKHLAARIILESKISHLLTSLPTGIHELLPPDKTLDLNEFITDYVASSQLAVLPCAEAVSPESVEGLRSIDNAVGISYISNVVERDPSQKAGVSILLSLFSERIQMENQLIHNIIHAKHLQSTAKQSVSMSTSHRASLLSGALSAPSAGPKDRPFRH